MRHSEKVSIMKRLFLILILMFSFNSWSNADDIRDLEIEGMSIGDSLLDYFSKDEIEKNIQSFYKNNEYAQVEFNDSFAFKKYWGVDINFLTNDKNYTIVSISGVVDYRDDIIECTKQVDIIFNDLGKQFTSWNKKEVNIRKHTADKSGKSTFKSGHYSSVQGFIVVGCYDYSLETGWMDHLTVSIKNTKFNDWLNTKAYE